MNDEVPLPTVVLAPNLQSTHPKEFPGIVAMFDDENNSYLCVPCVGMELTIALSIEAMQRIVDVLTEQIQDEKEYRL